MAAVLLALFSATAYGMSDFLGGLSAAGILASLYPAGTVLRATAILKERIHARQGVGLGLCAVAVTCVAAG